MDGQETDHYSLGEDYNLFESCSGIRGPRFSREVLVCVLVRVARCYCQRQSCG